jgi:hypothetical protein
MAITYLTFKTFPLEIEGITSEWDTQITAIKNFVVSDMAAVGVTVSDAILSYFVYWFLCQEASTTVTAETGETAPISKTTYPDFTKQIRAWNLGAISLRTAFGITQTILDNRIEINDTEKIKAILLGSELSVNQKYLSKISLL